MKGLEIPAALLEGKVRRCGAIHPYANLTPRTTALVVIDMQVAYMDAARGLTNIPDAHAIVATINTVAGVVRKTGGQVYMIKQTVPPVDRDDWTSLMDLESPAFRARRVATLSEGTPGHDLIPTLDVRPEDEICHKHALARSFRALPIFRTAYGRVRSIPCSSPALRPPYVVKPRPAMRSWITFARS